MSHPQNLYGDVRDFHKKFGLAADINPRELSAHMHFFRVKFMKEELQEYIDATDAGDLEKQFDALIDLVYVAIGTALMHGFDFNEGWRRVHNANMQKVRVASSEDSAGATTRGSKFDVKKPPGWQPPVLTDLVLVKQADGSFA